MAETIYDRWGVIHDVLYVSHIPSPTTYEDRGRLWVDVRCRQPFEPQSNDSNLGAPGDVVTCIACLGAPQAWRPIGDTVCAPTDVIARAVVSKKPTEDE